MSRSRFSIRHQLLLLGALATGSIWAGALLQYFELRHQSQRLQDVQHDLRAARQQAEVARLVAQERGLSNGWLAQATGGNTAELVDVRRQVDASLGRMATSNDEVPQVPLAVAVSTRVEQLPRLRGRIDRRELRPPEAFGFYSALVAHLQDGAARRLADGMVAVGLPYEHLNHLQQAAEHLAQLRGVTNGVLRSGELTPPQEAALLRQRALYDQAVRLYSRSVPATTASANASALDAPAVSSSLERINRLLELRRVDLMGLDATAWWTLASEAVDTLQRAAAAESTALAGQADTRMAELNRRQQLTVAALVVLGVVTLFLVLGTVGRIVRGLRRLLDGLEAVGTQRSFDVRIDDTPPDEFGTISSGINKLIAVAGSVVEEQERLSMTDGLTAVTNRRGFDLQLSARTTPSRQQKPPLSLVMIDVDHFKSINDSQGHATGDTVLKSLAQVLRSALRPDDLLARFGGEEFVALLPGCPLPEALAVTEKLRAAVQAHDFGFGRPVTASFGVAQFSAGQSPEALIAAADARLYAAKAAGRNRVMPVAATATDPPPAVADLSLTH
jgi:diguanylate cyclase (GGDEF)-like protein